MCREAVFKQTFFLMCVFNKILITLFTKLTCFSLWAQCSSACTYEGTAEELQSPLRSLKMGVWTSLRHTWRGWVLVQHNLTEQQQTRCAAVPCPFQGKKQAAKQRALGAEHLHSQIMSAWMPPSPGPRLWTGRHAAASASAAEVSVLYGKTLPGSPGKSPAPACSSRLWSSPSLEECSGGSCRSGGMQVVLHRSKVCRGGSLK